MTNLKQIIVMRKDLNMRKGKMIAQGAHASVKATVYNLRNSKISEWLAESFTKIVVSVNSEEELIKIKNKAIKANIICEEIIDNGNTEFGGVKTRTCIAVGPDTNENLDPITGDLKLL